MIEKADTLLKAQEEASTFTTEPTSISGWLENTTTRFYASITEVPHPLASSPIVKAGDKASAPNESFTPRKSPSSFMEIKEEPCSPKCSDEPFLLSTSTTPQLKVASSKRKGKDSLSPKRPQPIRAIAPLAAPQKQKPKVRGLSILHSALEVPLKVKLLTSGKKPKATSTPQNIVVRYNPHSCRLGGLPSGSIEMKELKNSADSPIKKE